VQQILERPILVESTSSCLAFCSCSLSHWEFLATLAEGANSGILLYLRNIFVSASNHVFDLLNHMDSIPPDRLIQLSSEWAQ
jgi:uncharacterized protein (UPF0276 family)